MLLYPKKQKKLISENVILSPSPSGRGSLPGLVMISMLYLQSLEHLALDKNDQVFATREKL